MLQFVAIRVSKQVLHTKEKKKKKNAASSRDKYAQRTRSMRSFQNNSERPTLFRDAAATFRVYATFIKAGLKITFTWQIIRSNLYVEKKTT